MKYLKSLLYILISILISTILITTVNYFDILGNNIIKYLKLIVLVISILIGSIYIGRRSKSKGYLEGIKIGLITIFILILLNYLGFDNKISLDIIIYYLIILVSSILGSIIGINKKLK